MSPEIDKLRSALKEWNIDIDDIKLEKFDRYMQLLLEWNKKMNLTAITEPDQIVIEHFMDSISLLKLDIIEKYKNIIDVGTGAGFPGLPLKIMVPEIQIVLLDSLRKRTEFLQKVVEDLQLEGVSIIHGRAEDMGRREEYREKFDIVVSRAVAPLRILLEYCVPFVKLDGYFVSYKGPAAYSEIEEAQNALKELKVKNLHLEQIDIPYSEKQHNLIIIQKASKTPNKYPRSPGKVKKSPL